MFKNPPFNSRFCVRLTLLASVFGLAGISSAALPDPGKILSCTLSDKITETVIADQVVTAGTTSISISMALGYYGEDAYLPSGYYCEDGVLPIDLDFINVATTIKLQIGGYSYDGTLADDPNIAVNLNKRSVFIPANVNPATNKPIGTNGLKVSWTSTKVTFTVLRSLTDQTDNGSPLAKSLLQIAQSVGTTSTVLDQLPITLEFSDIKGAARIDYVDDGNGGFNGEVIKRPCYIKGTRVAAAKVVSGQTYNLNTITLTGVIDRAIPTLTVIVPNGGVTDATGAITLTGKVTDGYGIDYVGIPDYFNPLTFIEEDIAATITQTIKGPPQGAATTWHGATEKNWSLAFTNLPYGRNNLGIVVRDKSGNYKYISAIVTRKLPSKLVGRWDALLNESSSADGYMTFNVTDTGVISGSIRLNETSAATSFTGAWSGERFDVWVPKADGAISGELLSPETLSTQTESQLRMSLYMDEGINGGVAQGEAYRTPFTSKNVLPADSPFLGAFNGKLAGLAASYGGNGHFSIVTSNAGLNTISGRLSDGTAFTASSAVGAAGQVSFFTSLYRNKGFLLTKQLRTNGDFVDDVHWVFWKRPAAYTDKQFPDGFHDVLTPLIRRYTAPLANERILGLTNSDLGARWWGDDVYPEELNLLVSTANRVTVKGSASAFKATIATKTGLVTGSCPLPTTVPLATATYSALIVGNQITGHYISPAPKGSVLKRFGFIEMKAPPPPGN